MKLKELTNLTLYAGMSMWPTFKPGDALLLDDLNPSELAVGDVVVFLPSHSARHPGSLVCHRIIAIETTGGMLWFTTQGDYNRKPDIKWSEEQLVGRVVEVSPASGKSHKKIGGRFTGWRRRNRFSLRRILRSVARRMRKLQPK